MDEYLIYEFTTEVEAQSCLTKINEMAAQYWFNQGHTILENSGGKELVGKKGGQDNLQAMRTFSWDEIRYSPEGTYYFTSLRNDARFSGGMPELESAFTFTEKPLPQEWVYDVEMS